MNDNAKARGAAVSKGKNFELTPDMYYFLQCDYVSYVLATGTNDWKGYLPNTEYWALSQNDLPTLISPSATKTLVFRGAHVTEPPAGFPPAKGHFAPFMLPEQPGWQGPVTPPNTMLWMGTGLNGCTVGIAFSVHPSPSNSNQLQGSMFFLVLAPEMPTGPIIGDQCTLVGAKPTTETGSLHWYAVVQNIVNP